MMMYAYRREKGRNLLKENKINALLFLSFKSETNIMSRKDKRKLNKSRKNFEERKMNLQK